jgi:hypothetical protein
MIKIFTRYQLYFNYNIIIILLIVKNKCDNIWNIFLIYIILNLLEIKNNKIEIINKIILKYFKLLLILNIIINSTIIQ